MWAGPSVVKRAYSDMGTKKPPTAWQWAAFGGCFGVRGFERCSGGLDFSRVFSRGMRLFPPLFPPSLIHGGDRGR